MHTALLLNQYAIEATTSHAPTLPVVKVVIRVLLFNEAVLQLEQVQRGATFLSYHSEAMN